MARPRKLQQARTADATDATQVVALLLADDPTVEDDAELRRLLAANAKLTGRVADVGGYCRISEYRSSDGDGSIGVVRQAKTILRHATEKRVRVVRWYLDNDFSAANPNVKRPSYLALLEDIRAGSVGGLLVLDVLRLYRQSKEFRELVEVYESFPKARRPHVATTDGQLDLTTEIGRFVAELLVLIGNLESAMISKRVRNKADARFEDGRWHGGQVPYGYRSAGERTGELVIDQDEADVVHEAARLVLTGQPLSKVVRDLNTAGHRMRNGGLWRRTTLRQILLSPLYAGVRVHRPRKPHSTERDGEERRTPTDKWDAILTEGEAAMLRVVLTAEERRTTPERGGHVRAYLGSGALTCGACGSSSVRGKPRSNGRAGAKPIGPGYSCMACRRVTRDVGMVDEFLHAFLLEAAASEGGLLAEALAEPTDGDGPGRRESLARLTVVQAELGKDAATVVRECGLTFASYADIRRGLEAEERDLLSVLAPARQRPAARVLPPVIELEALLGDPAALQLAHDLLTTYLGTYALEVVLSPVGRGSHHARGHFTSAQRPDLYGITVRPRPAAATAA